MRVAHLMTSLNPGGVATFMTHLLPQLAQKGIENEVFVTMMRGAMADEVEASGIPVSKCLQHGDIDLSWSYRVGKVLRQSAIYTFLPRLVSTLRQLRPDIVHSHIHGAHWAMHILAAHLANAPLLITLHSPSSQYPQTWQARRLYKPQTRRGDRIVGLAPGVYQAYEGFLSTLPPQMIAQEIPYGLPDPGLRDDEQGNAIRQTLGIPQDTLVIGSVGRLIDEKHYHDLLDAMARLDDSSHLLLVGDGGERPRLEAQIDQLGLRDRCHLPGFQTNPTDWLDAMDIYALPSRSEGLPVALLEAMAKGLPIVATAVRGTLDLVSDGENGLLVPFEDVGALTESLTKLAGEVETRERISKGARRHFLSRYTVDHAARAYEALYKTMLTAWRS